MKKIGVTLAMLLLFGAGAVLVYRLGHVWPAAAKPSVASASRATRPVTVDGPHIALIVMENKEDSYVLGSPSAPFINTLAKNGAVATNMYAVAHPSLPNYLALVGGSTFGITSDCTSCSASGASLGTQLSGAGISWKAYVEDLPGPCYSSGGNGEYAKKHVPFLYFPQITASAVMCSHIVNLSQLSSDESSGRVPAFVWITPNLCSDTHDCGVITGDKFLSQLVPPLSGAMGPNGIIIITWDEGSTNAACCGDPGGGHIAFVVTGGAVRPGASTADSYDHFSVLRFIEQRLGLAPLGAAAARTPTSLSELVKP